MGRVKEWQMRCHEEGIEPPEPPRTWRQAEVVERFFVPGVGILTPGTGVAVTDSALRVGETVVTIQELAAAISAGVLVLTPDETEETP